MNPIQMMKLTLTSAACVLALNLSAASAADDYKIDTEKSEITFKIMNKPPNAATATEVPGKFTKFSGKATFDNADASKNSVEVEVETSSVDTDNTKRDDHLKNQDFFKVKEHPKMTFKSTKVKKNDDGDYDVTGDFTLLGVTKSISIVLKKDGDNTGTTTFQIKRSDYGMKYRIPDTADEVDVTIKFVGKKEKAEKEEAK
jgi:polyisoprenoid-binding protein YceI